MLSIVVTWRNRNELGRALPNLAATAQATGGDLTVVNFGGDRKLLGEQLAQARDPAGGGLESVRLLDAGPQRYFHKARAQNLGAGATAHPALFFCDCDIVVEPTAIAALLDLMQRTPGTFATLAGVRESERNSRRAGHVVRFGYQLRLRTADGRELEILDHEEDAEDGTRQAPGLLMVRREDFLRVDGYNAELHGWGWEDQDMISRLTLGAGLERIQHGHALHLSHDDQARIGAYPATRDRWESRDRMFRTALANYDRADFQGTYRQDVRDYPTAQLALGELLGAPR